ncbi:MAG TPA: mechanosensitive ion channel domain-containing protein [Caldimonas sp.]|jgi:small-conductance mechanosensitive channel|nr:mechanosensitive ion channel domain-containing protein [Caldimonas sp.]HEX2542026.1 mechanosensitive ion channel domain-containing protein [Caldimonas sp.]
MELLGIRLVGFNETTGHKVLLTIGLLLVLWLLRSAATALLGRVDASGDRASRIGFWARQGVSLVVAALAVIGFVSIWFDDPANLTTAVGLVTAGLAFALQKVVTSLAGYFVILRGSTFSVGDRITMGGVRGDVVALGFFQTTIMEMGQPPAVQSADPAVWVQSRQFTGRIVTVANSKIFDEPVYNYTREFPFIWEEMRLPISYRDDRSQAERILLDAAQKHAVDPGRLDPRTIERLEHDFRVSRADFAPSTYWRLTDNWVEITVRFLAHDHGVRKMKDAMSREVLARLEQSGIGIASATFEITGLPEVQAKVRS